MNFNVASIVLLVVLCWMSVGTYASGHLNGTASGNTTDMHGSNSTMMNGTMMNGTMMNGTMMNGTMMNGTMMNGTMMNGTMMNGTIMNGTMMNGTMMNGTMMNGTMMNGTMMNGTMMNGTMDGNSTGNATPAAIEPNTTVAQLVGNFSRGECRKSKLCAAQPVDCDPTNSSCYFVSVKSKGGRNFDFELAGETEGYLGCTLKPTGGNETAYLCVKSNGKVLFFGGTFSNGKFTDGTLPVNNVKAKMNGQGLHCSFAATVPNATARAEDTTFVLSVVTGTYNATTGAFGAPTVQIRTNPVDLTNTTANTDNTVTSPGTSAGSVPLPALSSALLVVLGVLNLFWL